MPPPTKGQRPSPPRPATVKEALDRLYRQFDLSFLRPDPLAAPLRYSHDPGDLETAALLAALFAYGRADLIEKNVTAITTAMAKAAHGSPARFCEDWVARRDRRFMPRFVYRFQTRADLSALITAIGKARHKYGSLLNLFLAHDNPAEETVVGGVAGMAEELGKLAGKRAKSRGFAHLLSSPANGGAAKRWMLFMRWMVRCDQVDPGPWSEHVDKRRLVIPLDVHVGRIARRLGLLNRKSDDGKAALQLTRTLRKFDPGDPIRYDFALCSFGKLGYCVSQVDQERCESCDLATVCLAPGEG